MVILSVHSDNIKIKYKSTLISEATLIVIITEIILIILPFIFGYHSNGFWLKRDVFYEQPSINFRGEYFLIATTNSIDNPIKCSTQSSFHPQVFQCLDKCSTIKVRELDYNFDGKTDELVINIKINLNSNLTLTSITLIIPIDYKLNTYCNLQMKSAIIYQQFLLPTSISDYSIFADLALTQSSPLYCRKKFKYDFYDYLKIDDKMDLNMESINNFLKDFSKRNISTHLSNLYTSFIFDNRDTFNLNVNIRFPEHKIYYKPRFWQIIKWAWIQYFAIYVILRKISNYIKNYIFTHRLVLFYKESPLKKDE